MRQLNSNVKSVNFNMNTQDSKIKDLISKILNLCITKFADIENNLFSSSKLEAILTDQMNKMDKK